MATVSPGNATQERVRHPLDAVRAHIRRYVFLETTATVILVLALFFWIGLALDFGVFWTAAYDWILELNFLERGGDASRGVRIGVLACVGIGLAYLIATRLLSRLFKEFSDPAVALVLERRFPRELGDRLITAVELTDTKKAEAYGYSGPMLARTINEAADRVDRLPVADVFDWRRLRRRWLLAGLATLGVFAVVVGGALGYQTVLGRPVDAPRALLGFKDVAAIWTERNVLLKDSYWLRNAHIEIVRFQDTPKHPGEMRVARDESRPDVIVRAAEWVAPDRQSVGGWRALRMTDIPGLLGDDALAKIAVPADWSGWTVDLDDLDSRVPTGIVPAAWQGKTTGEARKELAQNDGLRENIAKAGASAAVDALADWRTWTLDKLLIQIEQPEVRARLEGELPAALPAIDELQTSLADLAASPWMTRRLRKLDRPEKIFIVFRGATTRSSAEGERKGKSKFAFSLADLKESANFFAHGGDSYTQPLKITLSPPPAVREMTVDTQEPAYLFHWLDGSQQPLKGKRQIFDGVRVSTTGETSALEVPLGTSMTLKALVDRPLKDGVLIRPAGAAPEASAIVPDNPVVLSDDAMGFSVRFDKINRTMEFQFEFFDEDNVRGKRRVRIRPIDDQAPEILNYELAVVLRKPRFKEGLARTLSGGGAADGLLVTPAAVLPFSGMVRDDVALADVRWLFETQPIIIEAATEKSPGRVVFESNPTLRRGSVIVSGLQFTPQSSWHAITAPALTNLIDNIVAADLRMAPASSERSAPLAGFVEALKAVPEESLDDLDSRLRGDVGRKPFLKQHALRDREVFSLKQHLADLPMRDVKTQGQMYHLLKIAVSAADNNVETGPSVSRTRTPISFLVVPETELLAQIGLEEEVLRDRLEKVLTKLKAAQTTMAAQLPTLSVPKDDTDFSLVVLRVDEVRRAALDSASTTREIFADYNRILQELEVNRVKADKISDVKSKIINPLEVVVHPTFGGFTIADDVLQRLSQGLDEDVAAKNVAKNLARHRDLAGQANDQLGSLVDQINAILLAIDRGLDFNELIQRVIAVEQGQRQVVEPLRVYHDDTVRKILEELTNPKN